MQRPLFRVSCKAAIYDETREYVLYVIYTPTSNGIPGGHLEVGEDPDDAMRRELAEEIGFVPENLGRKDFFMHTDGKLILGYTATCSKEQQFKVDSREIRELKWIKVEDIRTGKIVIDSYDEFIVRSA